MPNDYPNYPSRREIHKMYSNTTAPHPKRAFVTGVTGQVGSYMVEYLLKKGYKVVGLNRRKSVDNFSNIDRSGPDGMLKNPNFTMVEGDLTDSVFINNYFSKNGFDELYNLAAQSHVHSSFEQPELTFKTNTIGTLNLLEAIRNHIPTCKAYFASTSEMYGSSKPPQNLDTPFKPRSPYGCAKLAAHALVDVYRDSYNLNVACGVMFNTESPRRGDNFVTKKIVNYVKKYRELSMIHSYSDSGLEWDLAPLQLGNLDAKRDWSHVNDSVEAIYRICNQRDYGGGSEKPFNDLKIVKYKDYTFGSGKAYSVRDFLKSCLKFAFRDEHDASRFLFKGEGLEEKVYDLNVHTPAEGRLVVEINPKFFRPAEVDYLLADSKVITEELQWEPKISFDDLVSDMFLGR